MNKNGNINFFAENLKGLFIYAIIVFVFSCTNNNKTFDFDKIFGVAQEQAKMMLPTVLKNNLFPRSIERGFKPASDWCSGFFPGELWYFFEITKDNFWKKNAEKVTELLNGEQFNTQDHDIGFRIYCSYGNGYRLTGNLKYKEAIIEAAKSLSTRFNKKIGAIQSWEVGMIKGKDWKFPVIIDNMMNLELLFAATKFTGDSSFYNIATTHANTTLKNHYKADFSCPHIVDYNPKTGKMIKHDFNNGFSKNSAWSRGQGWSLYGFTMCYRETGDIKYLKHAERVAEYIINNKNMPEDMIPYCDYLPPTIPIERDASAGAITASGLLELSTLSKNGVKYFNTAKKMLESLSSEKYLSKIGDNGNFLIKHCTGNKRKNSEVNGTLIYADYYYIEALLRYRELLHNN